MSPTAPAKDLVLDYKAMGTRDHRIIVWRSGHRPRWWLPSFRLDRRLNKWTLGVELNEWSLNLIVGPLALNFEGRT